MAITGRADVFTNMAAGYGLFYPPQMANSPSTTAGAANSGFHTVSILASAVGSSYPSTFVSIPIPSGLSKQLYLTQYAALCSTNNLGAVHLAYFYKIGTFSLTSSGNAFTHDAATFPLLRTVYGQANQPIELLPLINVTTALTGTAAAFVLDSATSTTGYVNQSGNNVVGTKTFTFPSATTAVNSCYILRLEEGDSAVQDIVQMNVTSTATTGAGTIWGVEILNPNTNIVNTTGAINDSLFGGMRLMDLNPAVATSGTVTSFIGIMYHSGTSGVYTTSLMGAINQ